MVIFNSYVSLPEGRSCFLWVDMFNITQFTQGISGVQPEDFDDDRCHADGHGQNMVKQNVYIPIKGDGHLSTNSLI